MENSLENLLGRRIEGGKRQIVKWEKKGKDFANERAQALWEKEVLETLRSTVREKKLKVPIWCDSTLDAEPLQNNTINFFFRLN